MQERATVFIVDDDASVRKALQRLIRASGYEVEAFENGAAYLAKATPAPARCCLVLDIRMPGMSGLDLQRALNGTARSVPIIFITGHGDDDARNQALSAGAVDVLYKPLDEHVLLEAIERALGRARQTP